MKKTIINFVLVCFLVLGCIRTMAQPVKQINSFPAFESFEDWQGGEPVGWKVFGVNASSWLETTIASPNEFHSGRSGAKIAVSGVYNQEDFLVSPKISLPVGDAILVGFYASGYSLTESILEVRIARSDSNQNAFNESPLATFHLTEVLDQTNRLFTYYELDLSAYQGEDIYIAFVATTPKNGGGIFIDDVILKSKKHLSPTNVTFAEIGMTSVKLLWSPLSKDLTEVVCSTTPLSNPSQIAPLQVMDSSVVINNLSPSKNYYVYLRAKGNEISKGEWIGPYVFSTLCTVYESYYRPGRFFESNFSSFNCWAILDKKGNTRWNYNPVDHVMEYKVNPLVAHEGADDWLVLPEMKIPQNQILKIYYAVGENGPERFSVWFIQDTANVFQGAQPLLPSTIYYHTPKGADSLIIDLSSLQGRYGHIAIRQENLFFYADLTIKSIMIHDKPSCLLQSFLQLDNLTETSARLRWKSDASKFEVKYSTDANYDPDDREDAEYTTVVTDNNVEFTGLIPGTAYYVFVRTVCSDVEMTQWSKISFRTLKSVREFPYVEDFEKWLAADQPNYSSDWTIIDGNGDMNSLQGVSGGMAGLVSQRDNRFYFDRNQWMISPKICLPAGAPMQSTFYVRTIFATDPDYFDVAISTTNMDTASFTTVVPEMHYATNKLFCPVTLDLSPYQGKEIYIAIRLKSKVSSNAFAVDNFSISESNPSVPRAFKLEMLGKKSAKFSWDGTANSYRLAYQRFMFNPHNEDQAIYSLESTNKQIEINNLSVGAYYYVYAQAMYGGGRSSEWVGPIQVFIPCSEETVPFYESFDGWYAFRPEMIDYPIGCWKYTNKSSPISNEAMNDKLFSADNPTVGKQVESAWNEGFGVKIVGSNAAVDTADRYLITPRFRMPKSGATLSYWVSPYRQKVYYSIKLSTTGTKPEDFEYTLFTDSLEKPASGLMAAWVNKFVQLRDKSNNLFPDSLVYLAFVVKGTDAVGGPAYIRLDDFRLDSVRNACSYPDSVVFTDVSGGVKATWIANASQFEYVYSSKQFDPNFDMKDLSSKTVTGNELIINELQPGKVSYFWIRGLCEGDKKTVWRGPFLIQAPCGTKVASYPYVMDFTNWVKGAVPPVNECWSSAKLGTSLGFFAYNLGTAERNGISGMAAYSTYKATIMGGMLNTSQLPAGTAMKNYLKSPEFQIGPDQNLILKFKYNISTNKDLSFTESFHVLVSTRGVGHDSLYTDTLAVVYERFKQGFREFKADLSRYKGMNIAFAIVHSTLNTSTTSKTISLIIDDVVVEKNDCPIVTNVIVGEVNQPENNVDLSWEGTSESGWLIHKAVGNFDPYIGEGDLIKVNEGNTHQLMLEKYSNYTIYIRPDGCTSTEFWHGPYQISNCGNKVNDFPYIEDFSAWYNSSYEDHCWTYVDADNDLNSFTLSEEGRANAKSLRYTSVNTLPRNIDDWMILPKMNLENVETPLLEMWVKSSSNTGAKPKFKIYVSDLEQPSIADFTECVDSFYVESRAWRNNKGAWMLYTSDLSSYSGRNSVSIAIRHCSESISSVTLNIDDISLVDVKSCFPIAGMKIVNSSTSTTEVAWENPSNANRYTVAFSEQMFDYPHPSSNVIFDKAESVMNEYSYQFSNLAQGTEYYYYISPACEADEDNNPAYGPYQFKTDCESIAEYPYVENFDNLKDYQNRDFGCWNVIDGNNDFYTFMGFNGAFKYAPTRFVSDSTDEYLISPSILLPTKPRLSFRYETKDAPESFEVLIAKKSEVRALDGQMDLSKFVSLAQKLQVRNTTDQFIVSSNEAPLLADYIGEEVYFIVHLFSPHFATDAGNIFIVDDFTLTTEDACLLAPTSINVIPSISAAEVSWLGDATKWMLEYWSDENPHRTEIEVAETHFLMTDLKADGMEYFLRVRSACDEVEGQWSEMFSFITLDKCSAIQSVKQVSAFDTASLSWTDHDNLGIAYQISWGSADGSISKDSTVYSLGANFRNLVTDIEYVTLIRKICGNNDTSQAVVVRFNTYSLCPQPTLLMESVTKRSALLSWQNPRASKNFISYRIQDSIKWHSDTISTNSIEIVNLIPGTNYEWFVSSECEKENVGAVAFHTFTTLEPAKYQLNLSVNNADYGQVEGMGLYIEGALAKAKAIPATGYEFLRWENELGTPISSSEIFEFDMDSNTTLKAIFAQKCDVPSYLNVLSYNPDSCVLVWEGRGDSYIVYYKDLDATSWDSVDVRERELVLTHLKPYTRYIWKVLSKCQYGDSKLSVDFEFVTDQVGISNPRDFIFHFYPNPVPRNTAVTIILNAKNEEIECEIFDLTGKLIKNVNLLGQKNEIEITNIPSGVYVLKIRSSSWSETRKLIIE